MFLHVDRAQRLPGIKPREFGGPACVLWGRACGHGGLSSHRGLLASADPAPVVGTTVWGNGIPPTQQGAVKRWSEGPCLGWHQGSSHSCGSEEGERQEDAHRNGRGGKVLQGTWKIWVPDLLCFVVNLAKSLALAGTTFYERVRQ